MALSPALPTFPLDIEAGPGLDVSRSAGRLRLDLNNPALPTTGTGNAYRVSTGGRIKELRAGVQIVVQADRTNTGPATLLVDQFGAKEWTDADGQELIENRVILGRFYTTIYDEMNDVWRVQSGPSKLDEIPGLTDLRDEVAALTGEAQEAAGAAQNVVDINRASTLEAQLGVSNKLLSVATGKDLLAALLGSTTLKPAGASNALSLGARLDVRLFGAAGTGGNDQAGLASAFGSHRPILLPEGEFRVSQLALNMLARAKGSSISILGMGSEKTTLIVDPTITDNQAIAIGALEQEGPLAIDWPGTNGRFVKSEGTPVDPEHPTTAIHVPSDASVYAAMIGEWTYKVADASGIAVGDIIRIKTQCLDVRGETRNFVMRGETNEVVAVNGDVLTLRYQLRDSYSGAPVWSGKAIAGAGNSVTIATGLNANLVAGCRVRAMGGTGQGQTRYITSYDPATGVALIDGEGIRTTDPTSPTYGQHAFSPTLGPTTDVIVDRMAFVFVTKPMRALRFGGMTIKCGGCNFRGISIFGVIDAHLEDIRVERATEAAFSFHNCIRPTGERLTAVECNNGTFGYTVVLSGCCDGYFRKLTTLNGRRGGVDTSGSTPTWGCLVDGVRVVGGVRDGSGALWGPENSNYGIGHHGQARNFVYKNIKIESVWVGYVQRGRGIVLENVEMLGSVWKHFFLLGGEGLRVKNADLDTCSDPSVIPQPAPTADGGIFCIQASRWRGGLDVDGLTGRGALGDLVSVDVSTGTPPGSIPVSQRVRGSLSIRNYRIDWYTPSPVALVNGTAAFSVNGWEFDEARVTIAGGGNFAVTRNNALTSSAATAGQSVFYRIGPAWTIAVANNNIVSVPSQIGSGKVGLRLFQNNNNANNVRANGALTVGVATFATHSTSAGSVPVTGLASKPTGSSGAAGSVSLHHSGSELTIENQIGSELRGTLVLEGC